MKRDYNYAYNNLLNSWNINLRALEKYNFSYQVKKLGRFAFTYKTLKHLEYVIEELNKKIIELENVNSAEFKYDVNENAKTQFQEYVFNILRQNDDSDDEEIGSVGVTIFRLNSFKMSLTRIQQDFEAFYKDIRSEFINICNTNNQLENFLQEYPWSEGVLEEIGFNLFNISLKHKNEKNLQIIFIKDSNVSNYKLDVLKIALVQKDYASIDLLLTLTKDFYSQGEVYGILGTKEYYDSSRESINKITEYLNYSKYELSAIHYQAMFLYNLQEYQEALSSFKHVVDKGDGRLKQLALLYRGFCFQYSQNINKAKEIFESIVENNINEYYDKNSTIKEHAIQHLNSLNNIEERQNNIKILNQNLQKIDNIYLNPYKQSLTEQLQKIVENINLSDKLTIDLKIIKKTLFEIKFIKLKQIALENIVIAQEFIDMPELYEEITKNIDKKMLVTYNQAIKEIDNIVNIVGKSTEGLRPEQVHGMKFSDSQRQIEDTNVFPIPSKDTELVSNINQMIENHATNNSIAEVITSYIGDNWPTEIQDWYNDQFTY